MKVLRILFILWLVSFTLAACGTIQKPMPPQHTIDLARAIHAETSLYPTTSVNCVSQPIWHINGSYSHHMVVCH